MRKIFYLAGLIVFIASIFSLPFLVRVKIQCVSQYGECPAEIDAGVRKYELKNYFQAKRGMEEYLSGNFSVSGYQLQFKLPNILKINLIVKKPVFAIRDKASGQIFLTATDGKILLITKSSALPILETDVSAKAGDTFDSRIVFASKLVNGVFEMYQVSFGRIENGSLLVDLPRQIKVLFPLEGDTEVLLGSLRLIYTRITGEAAGKYSQIDLRFKNPVLR